MAEPTTLTPLLGRRKTLLHIIYCFLLYYLLLLIFSLPILFILFYRHLLFLLFSISHKGKYKLLECANAFFALDRYANVFTVYFFLYIDGPCDIDLLRLRLLRIFRTSTDKNGDRLYEVMFSGLVTKFGFFCWENMEETFDITKHVRYLPGCSDPNQIYSESEVLEASGKLADDLWPPSRPRWEMLVVAQMRKDGSGKICSVIHLRLHHAYVDGISAVQILRLCIVDKPSPLFSLDPVNPPIPPMPFCLQLATYLQVIFLGPWSTLRLLGSEEEHIFYEGPLTGGKYFTRAKSTLPMKSMKDIRKAYRCSTSTVLQFGMTGALQKMALKKGFPLPDEVLGSIILALLPYPNEGPQNRAIVMPSKFPVGVTSPRERLRKVDKVCRATSHPLNYYTVLASKIFFRVVGLFPPMVIEKSMGSMKLSYFVSNVPGISQMYFDEKEVLDVFGVGPLANGCRYFVGVSCYKDEFTFGFQAEKSSLIQNQEDINELAKEFENEMKWLVENVHSKRD